MTSAVFNQDRMAKLFASIDGKDAAAFVGFLTEDATFRFGSAEAIKGRAAIAAGVDAFFASIKACSHNVTKTIAHESTLICEGEVTYTRHDDTKVGVPFVDIFELTGDLINDYKIYIDISPVYSG